MKFESSGATGMATFEESDYKARYRHRIRRTQDESRVSIVRCVARGKCYSETDYAEKRTEEKDD